MTQKGGIVGQACAACKYQRKRCSPECALAPHFRPENPMVFKNVHKLFGVRKILRILEQIDQYQKPEAMRSIIYEANMRDLFPVHGCLGVICEIRCQIREVEDELCSVLTRLAFYKQQQATTLSPIVFHGSLQLGMAVAPLDNAPLTHFRHNATTTLPISSHDNANLHTNKLWLQETNNTGNNHHEPLMSQPSVREEEEVIHNHEEVYSFFDNTENRQLYIDSKEEDESRRKAKGCGGGEEGEEVKPQQGLLEFRRSNVMIGIAEIVCVFILLFVLHHSSPAPICTNSSQLKLCEPNGVNCCEPNGPQAPKGLCLEKLGNGSYVDMVPHPDGSNRVFLCNQQGKIWLAMVPEVGSSQGLMMDESDPFLDLSDQVQFATEMGLMSIAFHPNFTSNGRFFVAYNCDKFQQPGCEGRCSCNTDVGCDPSKVELLQEINPCQFHVAIAEFTANGTTTSTKLSWKGHANLVEARRIFTMGLPFEAYHAGQILFGPADGYLYFMIGDASHDSDPYNFAQNKKSLLGKILRLDVDIIPSAEEIIRLGLWGNYSIPKDNPYTTDTELNPEIWALGFGNPWRCSFDSQNPSRFVCGEIGKNQYEEIDLIKKGGNYGWRVYEGPHLFHPSKAPGGYTKPSSITPIFPLAGYNHDNVDTSKPPASVIGGYFYRAATDPCLYGWTLNMSSCPKTRKLWVRELLEFQCPFWVCHDSPMQCGFKPGVHGVPDLGYVVSLSEDNNKDVYLLTSSGVYRVAAPSRCGYRCAKERYSNSTRGPESGALLKAANLGPCFLLCFLVIVFL
ncbi:hypothetical protein OSB04_004154 [Centaurea solstitialis]|uniref:LOB domain-containing protein n=1 Tax=Centaurea solstitialis TaxID=347529 RepID=A0AA38U3P2_9ASTR|nr:hypothetical protein OSB04_004154 [Centaurea solstitialis]